MTSSRSALLLVVALAWPLPLVAAADPATVASATLASAEGRVAAAGEALAAAEAAPDALAPLARAVADYAAALEALRAEVLAAGAREAAVADDLAARRLEISRLLAAMEAMSAAPREALHPQGPLAAARASAMIDRLEPAMREGGRKLAEQVAELGSAREAQAAGKATLAAGLGRLAAAQDALAAAMVRAEPAAGGPADPKLAMLARDSASLTALAAALAGEPGAPAAPEGPAEALAWPVAGTIVSHYEEPDAARVRRPGLIVGTAPLALVTAPADGLVRYAGPFLEYGYVVVLEPNAETMVVLAGLARLQVATGATVRRGDLLGLMGGRPPDVEEYVMLPEAETGAGAGETLYIEVRRGKGPVDPEPLLVGQNG
ncbi:MAG TPA: peptidoglycan DD-metalloendopeptidase family protein [Amaricoccus sp.]|nr:peptidoglycan DD-metalloendopeptidase family protein [Amaricoccus sp.]